METRQREEASYKPVFRAPDASTGFSEGRGFSRAVAAPVFMRL